MNEKHPVGEGKDTGKDNAKPKKPYHKPEFRYEKVFETMALACGKIRGVQAQCRFNRKFS
jgi:hypothetical protein